LELRGMDGQRGIDHGDLKKSFSKKEKGKGK
jgi:hypothetical protein